MFVPADKSTNLYKVSPIQYKKLLSNSITTSYQKIKDDSILDDIDKQAKQIAQNLKLEDRIECFPHLEAFITLKDHKENFHNKPTCRLINPAKSELRKIAKFHIDKINKIIRAKTNYDNGEVQKKSLHGLKVWKTNKNVSLSNSTSRNSIPLFPSHSYKRPSTSPRSLQRLTKN